MTAGCKLVWREGMLMLPQHFQRLDLYHERLLDDRLRGLTPHAWGVVDLAIDEQALTAGVFRLVKARVILPDGAVVQLGQGTDAPPGRPVEPHLPPGRSSVGVHLAVPAIRESAPNLAEPSADDDAGARRLVAEIASVPDLNTGASAQPIEFARPHVRFLFDGEPLDGYDTLKIAELIRTKTGALALREGHVPPCVRIGASPFLMEGLRRLLTLMIARQKALAAGRRERGSSGSVEFGAADVQALWMLQALNSTIPVLRHAHERGWVAPEQLYVELARLCGQLFTLRFEGDPTSVPGFNYTELGATFRALFDLLEKLVGIDLGDALTSIPLEQKQPGFYLGRVGDSKLFDHAAFYLGVGGEVAETILRDRIPRLVKVGSADQISQIIGAALPGVRAEIDYRPPGCIPVRSGNIYLRLEKSGAYWDRIRSTGTIAIYQPLEPARLRLELLAIAEAG